MVNTMVVDDERIIREGITRIIPWEKYGLHLNGVADNGLTAWSMIQADPPQIVITDIKMPGMDGLELISKVHAAFPKIRFVVLSGYGEFNLAKEAMRYGVKHYLVKPCNEKRIIEALVELVDGLQQETEYENSFQKKREQLEHVLPLVKEQFIRDYVAYRHCTHEEYDYYCSLLEIDTAPFWMIVMEPGGEYTISELFGLMEIVDTLFGAERYLNTVLKDHLVSIIRLKDESTLEQDLRKVQKDYENQYHAEINLAYSEAFVFERAPEIYQELNECLVHALHLGSGIIITPRDLGSSNSSALHKLFFDYDRLAVAVKNGDRGLVKDELNRFFCQLRLFKYGLNVWKTYATELFVILIRYSHSEDFNTYLDHFLELQRLGKTEAMQEFIISTGLKITLANYETIRNKQNKIIGMVTDYIREHLENEDLSLKQLAGEVAFMNENYLGKLFQKEIGEKFSHYILRLRMERAKELIEKNGADRIYEIAQNVGLGNNPQYFSQLFKKYTGQTPSEFKNSVGNGL